MSAADVATRVAHGQTNDSGERSSRTFGEILRANLLTRFNAILGVLLIAILAVRQPQDALFGIVLVSNALIGIVQESRAKRVLDRLAVLNAPPAPRSFAMTARRDIAVDEVVLDDLIALRPATRSRPMASYARPRVSRSTSRCSPASPSRRQGARRPSCSRAASSSPAQAASRQPRSASTRTPASSRPRPGSSRSRAPN